MLRRQVLIASLAAAYAAPALAAEEKLAAIAQYVDVTPVAVPILADGRIVNYVFVVMRVQLMPGVDPARWRAKEPYFRDALARLCNRISFTSPKDYVSVDAPRLAAAFYREAAAIGGRSVKAVTLMSQTPKQRLGLPPRVPRPPRAEIQP
ncbi:MULTISPECIES: hypothetical protein [Phenylobacterium]|uniref:Uncharacterized protein n=1 Tax=Phenylobacterium koreense TaxID=266125 RepID=A0ABV2EM57_9CAUL